MIMLNQKIPIWQKLLNIVQWLQLLIKRMYLNLLMYTNILCT